MSSGYEPFVKRYTFEERLKLSRELLIKYPKMVPVVIQPDSRVKHIPQINKERFFLSGEMPLMQLHTMIRKLGGAANIEDGLFIFFGKSKDKNLENLELKMRDVYEKYKADDGFLYVTYANVSVF